MRPLGTLLVVTLAIGCGAVAPGVPEAEAGVEADDAGDGGTQPGDAGTDPADAGTDPADAGTDPADAGTDPADAGTDPTPWGGDCDPPFPGVPTNDWRHSVASAWATAQGDPNHRVRDVVLLPGEGADLRGRFTYGSVDKDLQDEDVELWLRRCPGWERVDTLTTDDEGIVHAALPTDLPKGEYRVRYLVLGDGSTADGVVAVWPAGTQALVTDIDGTLTTSDWQAVGDVVFGSDAEMYVDADTAIDKWAAKGYRILYLTGRPQYINRYSRDWLARHDLPFGPMQLAEAVGQLFPTDASVRAYKAARLRDLSARGVSWVAAYGNASTDIDAYADAEIPKADTYIVGPNAGEAFTVPIESYSVHLPVIDGYGDAVQP